MYQIETNIPMPKGRCTIYPFQQMKVGDSFSFDERDRNTLSSSTAYYMRKHPGVKFTIRKQSAGKCRVWRVA